MARLLKYREVRDLGTAKLSRRQFLLVSTATALAACTPSTSTPTPTQTSAAASAAATPVRGGVVRAAIGAEPLPLNGLLRHALAGGTVKYTLFSTFARIDPNTKKVVADLATGFDVSADGLTWIFHLQEKAKWHDGMDFTADDVLYNFQEMFKPSNASPWGTSFKNITKTEKIDRNTVKFTFDQVIVAFPFLTATTNGRMGLIPKHLLEGQDLRTANAFNNEKPVGTGPFKVTSIVAGSGVEMAAFDGFYRGRPNLDGVIWKIVPDPNVRLAQLKSGELDFDTIAPSGLPAVQADPKLAVVERQGVTQVFYSMNFRNEFFQDKKVRQALIYGLDRKAVMDAGANGRGELMAGMIPAVVTQYANPQLKPYAFDAEKAKTLLTEAGWRPGPDGVRVKDGKRMAFTMSYDTTRADYAPMAIAAQQNWKAIGIDLQIQQLDSAVASAQVFDGTFVIRPTSRAVILWDPDVMRDQDITNGASNFGKYSNPKVDQLLKDAAAELDPQKRQALYREYDATVYEDAHVIHGYFPSELQVTNRKLKGMPTITLPVLLSYINEWYLEK